MAGKNLVIGFLFLITLLFPAICFTEDIRSLLVSAGQEYVPGQKGDLDIEYSLDYTLNNHDDYPYFDSKLYFKDVKEEAIRNRLFFSYGLIDRLSVDAAFPYVHKRVEYELEAETSKESEYDLGDISTGIKVKLSNAPVINMHLRYFIPTGSAPYDECPLNAYRIVINNPNQPLRLARLGGGDLDYRTITFSENYRMNASTGSGHHILNPILSISKEFDGRSLFGKISFKRYLDSRDIKVPLNIASRNLNSYRFTRTSQSQYAWTWYRQEIQPGDILEAQLGYVFWVSPTFSLHTGLDYQYFFNTTLTVLDSEIKDFDYSAFTWFGGVGLHFIPKLPLIVRLSAGTADGDPFFNTSLRLAYLFKI